MVSFSVIIFALAALYCLVRGAMDLRQRRYVFGAIGIVLGVALAAAPIPTHSVTIDLPEPASSS